MFKKAAIFFIIALISYFALKMAKYPGDKLGLANDIIKESQQKDFESFDVFKTDLRSELVGMANERSMGFLNDLQGMEKLLKVANSQTREQINQLWENHYSAGHEEIITSRVSLLVKDLWEHQQASIGFLEVSYNIPMPLKGALREAMIKSFVREGIRSSKKEAHPPGMSGDVVSIVSGIVAADLSYPAVKNKISENVVGIISEQAFGNTGQGLAKETIQPKIAQSVTDVLNELLDGGGRNGGAYADIEKDIRKFHAEQKNIIISALRN